MMSHWGRPQLIGQYMQEKTAGAAQIPKLWNSLPHNLQLANNYFLFKSELLKHLNTVTEWGNGDHQDGGP